MSDLIGRLRSGMPNVLLQREAADVIQRLQGERDRLDALINNPQTDEFLAAVRAEMAHQVERWGDAHDRDKSAQNWFWLVGYLAGKALRAAITGDKQKALHHCVSSSAALGNWFKAIQADTSGCGAGEDRDIAPLAEGDREGEPPYERDPHMDGMLPTPESNGGGSD